MKNIEYVKDPKDREQMVRAVAEMVILQLQLSVFGDLVEERDEERYRLYYDLMRDQGEYDKFKKRRATFNSEEGEIYRELSHFDPTVEYGREQNIKTINEKVKQGLQDAEESIHLYRSVIQSDYAQLGEDDFTPQQKSDWDKARVGEYLFDPTISTEEVIRRLVMWSKIMNPKGVPALKALEIAYNNYKSASVMGRKAAEQVLMNCFYALELDNKSLGPLLKNFESENLKPLQKFLFLWSISTAEQKQIRAVMSYPKDFQNMFDFVANNLNKMSNAQRDQILFAMKSLEAAEAPFKELLRQGITRDEWEHVDETLEKLSKEISSAEMDLDDIDRENEPKKFKAQQLHIDYLERKEAALEAFKAMQGEKPYKELHEKFQEAAKLFVDVVKGIQLRLPESLPQPQEAAVAEEAEEVEDESRVAPPPLELMMPVPMPMEQGAQIEKPLSIQGILKKLNQMGRDISEADLPTLESLADDLKKYRERIENIKTQSPVSEDMQKKIIADIASMQEKIEERINEIPLTIHHRAV
ncbi:Uncharacterised protein [Legionella steigerwaltii]|uniref:Uncharacterized protein n=1 Tax=Legionella steigerwaltii TaxID=460 RepID=A0A378LC69_9GAMM|nr:hypothetical protein [Legionella steigerwaltii]KTD77816.1 hypothetical protein Lstg_1539 [Legionella steigerwaltii]STY24456.1 Uncharacterised protein [Legionella steigerwaltii]